MRICFAFIFFLVISLTHAQTFTSSNLPIVAIDTHGAFIADAFKITADIGIINNGDGVINNVTDPFNDYQGKIGIETRGSSSQFFPKKPYGFELRDDAGVGISASILGMPADQDWVLNATYDDRSLMRDALAYKLGRDLGRYAPRTRYCELVLNGEYQGVYLIVEKIKRSKNRVDISKLSSSEISGDDLTGGYILKIDKSTGNNSNFGFYSDFLSQNRYINFQYEYPKYEEMASEQMQYIQNYVKRFEQVLMSSTANDFFNGYRKYIDVNSCVDFLIINEVTRNVDGYRLSTFLYKDKESKDGKLTIGPIWDFNLGFGNADYCDGWLTYGWAYDFNSACGTDSWLVPFWWGKFMSDLAFRNTLATHWSELRQGKFSNESINAYIDSVADVMNQGPQQRNFQKWPIMNIYVWPNYDWQNQQTYDASVSWLKNWIALRMDWLDASMPKFITGIDTPEQSNDVVVWPNPFHSDDGVVEYNMSRPGDVEFVVYDLAGRTIGKILRQHESSGKYQIKLNQFDLAPGIYFGKLKNDQTTTVRKMIRE